MNTSKLEKLKSTAKRTLKILEMIEDKATPQEIVEKLGVNRSLVDYYFATLNKDE
jgi:hypothetical protein